VGYRDFVLKVARSLHLAGTVQNDEKDDTLVRIVAQGSTTDLAGFVRALSGKHGFAEADVQKVSEGAEDLRLKSFQKIRGSDSKETLERADESVLILGKMVETMDTGFSSLGAKMDQSLGKMDQSLGKMDQSLGKMDQSLGKMDQSLGKMDRSIEISERLRQETNKGFSGLGTKVDGVTSQVKGVGRQVERVETAVRAESRQNAEFRHDLVGAVGLLDAKYGAISRTLGRIEKALERQTRATEKQTAALLTLARKVSGRPATSSHSETRRPGRADRPK
jgi:acylphosphatase